MQAVQWVLSYQKLLDPTCIRQNKPQSAHIQSFGAWQHLCKDQESVLWSEVAD